MKNAQNGQIKRQLYGIAFQLRTDLDGIGLASLHEDLGLLVVEVQVSHFHQALLHVGLEVFHFPWQVGVVFSQRGQLEVEHGVQEGKVFGGDGRVHGVEVGPDHGPVAASRVFEDGRELVVVVAQFRPGIREADKGDGRNDGTI